MTRTIPGVVVAGWETVLRRKAVVDGNNCTPRGRGDARAERVVGFEGPKDHSATMVPDECGERRVEVHGRVEHTDSVSFKRDTGSQT